MYALMFSVLELRAKRTFGFFFFFFALYNEYLSFNYDSNYKLFHIKVFYNVKRNVILEDQSGSKCYYFILLS